MHTTHDYRNNKKKDEPELWIIHNGDWSGECYVRWTIAGKNKAFTYDWTVDGDVLLSGIVLGTPVARLLDKTGELISDDNPVSPVPTWVIGRAVALAVHTTLIRNIETYLGDL